MSILYILKSYFQRPAFDKLVLTVGIGCFVGGMFTLHGDNNAVGAFYFFAIALYMIHSVVASYLREVFQLETSVRVPALRRDQFKAWGLVLLVLFFYPVIAVHGSEIPFRSAFSMYLFIVAFTTVAAVIQSKGAILFAGFYGFLLLTVLLRIPPEKPIWQQIDKANWFGSEWGLPAVLMLASGACLVYCIKHFRNAWRKSGNDAALQSEFLRNYDRAVFPIGRLCKRLFKTLNPATNFLQQARLMQFSLFSPGSIFFVSSVSVAIGVFIVLLLLLHFDTPRPETSLSLWTGFALLIFYGSAVGLSLDFLQHRNLLPKLWVLSAAKTRGLFILQIIVSYVYVVIKQIPLIALLLYIMNLLTPSLAIDIWPIFCVGVGLQFLVLSIAMFIATEQNNVEAKGWTFANVAFAIIAFSIFRNTIGVLSNSAGMFIGVGILVCISLFFLLLSQKAWGRAELNFIGPSCM